MKFVALPALAVFAFAQTADVTGWSSAQWGMTLQQSIAAVPGLSTAPPQDIKGLVSRLRSGPVRLGLYPATAVLEFKPYADYLAAVTVTVDQSAGRASAFEDLKHGLVEKYGKPITDDAESEHTAFGATITTRNVQWRVKSSSIILSWIECRGAGYVSVRYSERKPDPTL